MLNNDKQTANDLLKISDIVDQRLYELRLSSRTLKGTLAIKSIPTYILRCKELTCLHLLKTLLFLTLMVI